MKKLSVLMVLMMSASLTWAGTREDLAVGIIPPDLLSGANSVVRNFELDFSVKKPAEAEYTCHKTVTILNEKAAGELSIALFYDAFRKVKSMSATVYDKNGKQMNKHNKNDMQDYAASDGFSLYQDMRVKYIRISGGEYPVTIDYSYTYEYMGILDYPDWVVQDAYQSVERSSLTVIVPTAMGINYKAYNIDLTPNKAIDKDNTILSWSVLSRKAISVPGSSYSQDYYLPRIDLSPARFEIAGYQGSLNTWKEFGAALSTAYKDRRRLNDKEIADVKELVKSAHNDHEKAEILYSYLQRNFRYVSVQIGMGGYIPFAACTVDSTKYGDCKALSNYMCALLNTVGITSYPTLINAGPDKHPIDTSFPSSKFNHCILYADIDHKPTWLECTSNALPFGELSTFTEEKYGLMLTEDGGKIINTPNSSASINKENVNHQVSLTAEGGAKISGSVELSGEYRPHAHSELILGSKKEQENYLYRYLDLKQSENPELIYPHDSAGVISVGLKSESAKAYDFNSGGKLFLPSTYIKKWYENTTADSGRRHDLILGFPHTRTEHLCYLMTDTARVSLPSDFDLDNDLMTFHRKSILETDKKITVETSYVQKKHILHPGEISLFKESLQKINKYLQQKVIIEK